MAVIDNKNGLGLICVAICIAGGMLGFGKFSLREWAQGRQNLIEVKGLSEKIVDADIAEIKITIKNDGYDVKALHKKREADKEKVMQLLQEMGFADEVYNSESSMWDYSDDIYENKKLVGKGRLFNVTDMIFVKTKKFANIQALKERLIQLGADKIVTTCECDYKLTNFQDLKLSMIDEAAVNAFDAADKMAKIYHEKISGLSYMRQGEISIKSETESASPGDNWRAQESERSSFKKKVRLVIQAGFKHE